MSLRDTILNADDCKLEKVTVPEWGCDVFIKVFSGKDREHMLKQQSDTESDSEKQALLLITSICDQDGKKVFTANDVAALSEKSSHILDMLTSKVLTVNGLNAEAVEEAEKN
mgnify:CR=1 FL=1